MNPFFFFFFLCTGAVPIVFDSSNFDDWLSRVKTGGLSFKDILCGKIKGQTHYCVNMENLRPDCPSCGLSFSCMAGLRDHLVATCFDSVCASTIVSKSSILTEKITDLSDDGCPPLVSAKPSVPKKIIKFEKLSSPLACVPNISNVSNVSAETTASLCVQTVPPFAPVDIIAQLKKQLMAQIKVEMIADPPPGAVIEVSHRRSSVQC